MWLVNDRALWGLVALSVGFGLLALVAIYGSMPGPDRAFSPPPVDQPGFTFSCYCYDRPLRVLIVDPKAEVRITAPQPQPAARARHAKQPPNHRARPDNHVSHAEAGGGGEGGIVPEPVAV
jgi:hypothetical protein